MSLKYTTKLPKSLMGERVSIEVIGWAKYPVRYEVYLRRGIKKTIKLIGSWGDEVLAKKEAIKVVEKLQGQWA